MPTNIELEKEVQELTRTTEKMQAMINTMVHPKKPIIDKTSVIERADKPEPGGGWVIEVERKDFTGMRQGIEFKGGIGIVPVEMEEAERRVHWLENDFGYQVQALNAEELAKYYRIQAGVKETEKRFIDKISK